MNNKLKAILIIAVFAFICIGSYSIFEPAIHVSYERINLINLRSMLIIWALSIIPIMNII